ncbi:MAG: hypothetical protein WCT01_04275 [Candidatus Shapirobacteria bacterium]
MSRECGLPNALNVGVLTTVIITTVQVHRKPPLNPEQEVRLAGLVDTRLTREKRTVLPETKGRDLTLEEARKLVVALNQSISNMQFAYRFRYDLLGLNSTTLQEVANEIDNCLNS